MTFIMSCHSMTCPVSAKETSLIDPALHNLLKYQGGVKQPQ
jgi:hypothetical protein